MITNNRRHDLEERTLQFAAKVRTFVRKIPPSTVFHDDIAQLMRSSASIGANYIEANEALGKRDFLMRIRISLKESKETRYWLRLLDLTRSNDLDRERNILVAESTEFIRIFFAIIRTVLHKQSSKESTSQSPMQSALSS